MPQASIKSDRSHLDHNLVRALGRYLLLAPLDQRQAHATAGHKALCAETCPLGKDVCGCLASNGLQGLLVHGVQLEVVLQLLVERALLEARLVVRVVVATFECAVDFEPLTC